MKRRILLGVAIMLTNTAFAQDCSCSDNFDWVRETFEKNDAGFQYMIDKKGEQEYNKHNNTYAELVKTIKDREKCAETLLDWLRFFRSGHLWFGLNNDNGNFNGVDNDSVKIIEQFSNWETYNYVEKKFNSYVSTITEPSLEGIWSFPDYTIGIKKQNDEYIGFILEADGVYWRMPQVKLKIINENDKLMATYFMKDHSSKQIEEINFVGKNCIELGFVTLKRVEPFFEEDESISRYLRFRTTEVPLFERLSDNTVILRIPSFSYSEKKQIDSVINTNWNIITSTENLIIDVRDNGGGSDESFAQILPIIYTNPIRTVGVELLSTPLNNQRMVDFINDPDWSDEEKKWARDGLKKLNQHIGEFVNLDSTSVVVERFDTIYTYPQNVGVIINDRNGSTTEQFLLAAKQSKKVKLFGTTTMGVLDISNMYSVESPCKDFVLDYSLSRSKRIPDMTIDDKGIGPDFYIDNTIPKYEWIEFVNNILSGEDHFESKNIRSK